MELNQLKVLLEKIQQKFPIIIKVENKDDQLVLEYRDFHPKDPDSSDNLFIRINEFDEELLQFGQLNNKFIEIYKPIDQIAFNDNEKNFYSYLSLTKYLFLSPNLQLFSHIIDKDSILLILRSNIITDGKKETQVEDDLLFSIKDLVCFFYRIKFQNIMQNLQESIDDESIIKSVKEKHLNKIKKLLNTEVDNEF
jgi:hypothetical protein